MTNDDLIQELEALAKRWENQAKTIDEKGYGPLFSEDYTNGIAAGMNHAQGELREVLDNYE